MTTKQLIEEAVTLPTEECAKVLDSLLRSFEYTKSDIENEWIELTKIRLKQIKEDRSKLVSGEDVFAKLLKYIEK